MNEGIIELKGPRSGPTSIILAGVHGDEKCGVEALERIIPVLKIERGRVLFGYGNPEAIRRNLRFAEMNLNRAFKPAESVSAKDKKTYEYKRARFLKKYLNKADCLLDVHASHSAASQPFVICEKKAYSLVRNLPFNLVVSGFDKIEPGGTDMYMNSRDKIGICAECGYLADPASTRTAETVIRNFLRARGHITGKASVFKQSYIKMYRLYLTKTASFKLAREFADFEKIPAGSLIGTDGNKNVRAPKDSLILFARNRKAIGEEAFLLGEYKKTR